jgi:hypothetical protein
MTIYDVPSLTCQAWQYSLTISNITAGFQKSGIYPYNPDVFTDADFAPSIVTDRPDPTGNSSCARPVTSEEENIAGNGSCERPVTSVEDNIAGNSSCERPVTSEDDNTVTSCNPVRMIPSSVNPIVSNPCLDSLPGEIVEVRSDGHCLLHAVSTALNSLEGGSTHNSRSLSQAIIREVSMNHDYYVDFSYSNTNIIKQVKDYVYRKTYSTDTGDIILTAICNAPGMTTYVYQKEHAGTCHRETRMPPGRPGVLSRGDIRLYLTGEGLASHYAALVAPQVSSTGTRNQDDGPMSSAVPPADRPTSPTPQGCPDQEETTPSAMPSFSDQESHSSSAAPLFSPEVLKPHPVAPPRSSTNGRKRRKPAILTDTPEKKMLREEKKKSFDKKKKKDQLPKRRSVKKIREIKKKKDVKKAKRHLQYTDDADSTCLVCMERWSASRPNEGWIQCGGCKNWSHEECTGVSNDHYICHHCDSDSDSVYAK